MRSRVDVFALGSVDALTLGVVARSRLVQPKATSETRAHARATNRALERVGFIFTTCFQVVSAVNKPLV